MELIEKKPKVSVCVVTYNQEKYIRQCLQSIVDQKTDFDFEIIVGDDCSTDGTSIIVAEYTKKYPNLIVSVLQYPNIGAVANIVSVYKKAKGYYIAHFDGDDFAFAGKLQAQVDILEKHPDCVICSHDMELVDENSKSISKSYKA
ncbi:hypothetical protein BH11PSE12_BH11PSE12_19750 [soil metagenome]